MRVLLLALLVVVLAAYAAGVGVPGGRAPVADADTTGSIGPLGGDPLMGLPVVSADGVDVGTVAAVVRTPDGRPSAVTVAVPGLLGLGEDRVTLEVGPGAFDGKVVRLRFVETDVRDLALGPDAEASRGNCTESIRLTAPSWARASVDASTPVPNPVGSPCPFASRSACAS